jgi:mannitol-1-phosphate/altronate dehydrogenase
MDTIKLNQNNLAKIAGRTVKIPEYDRKNLAPRIVHIGLGHFHRAHQAVYIDELLNKGLISSGIFEVNLVADLYPLAEIAAEQDYLYTLITRGARGEETVRVIGSIAGYLNAHSPATAAIPGDAAEPAASKPDTAVLTVAAESDAATVAVIARLASEETAVISLTITEKGYYFDTLTGDLGWDLPPVKHDTEYPDMPETAVGFIAAALEKRRKDGGGPVTIMSCDNFPSNGKILKTCVLSFCRKTRPDLIPWIEANVAFPLSMVDRITPATTGETLSYFKKKFGIDDRWAVCCEDFKQWVLEDTFKTGSGTSSKPQSSLGANVFSLTGLAKAGVQVVKEVEPYELMKIRLLNGSHSALSYPAYLMGHTGVAEATGDPFIQNFIRRHYMEEITATLPPVPGVDLDIYKDTLISRFSNKNIGDQVLRLASDGSKKIPISVINPLAEAVEEGKPCGAIVFALAAWARFLTGSGEKGEPIPLEDPRGPELSLSAKNARKDPTSFLRAIGIQEWTIAAPASGKFAGLVKEFTARLEEIYLKGIRKALAEFPG